MTRNVTAERAFADYLAMQPRSLARLFQNYSKTMPNYPPLATLKYWSKKHEWRQKIAEHEAQVEDQLRGKAAKAQASERWNAAQDLRARAKSILDHIDDKLSQVEVGSLGDIRAGMEAAISALSKADVLEDGISDSTETRGKPDYASMLGEFDDYRGLGQFRDKAEANKAKASVETAKDRGSAQEGDDDQ